MLDTGETISLVANKISDLEIIASTILDYGAGHNIWLFDGEMGSGKTTLIRKICDQIGVEDNVNSPSFGLVNEYMTQSGETLYHFDFYRIDNENEAIKIGVDEYFDSGSLCLIEWPQKIQSLLPSRHLRIQLNITQDHKREIYLEKYE